MNNQTTNGTLSLFERNRYFYGKLLTVRDFETEQDYMNEKRYLLNRLFDGAGIVCGFDDTTLYIEGDVVNIRFDSGGVALDCSGREIVVPPGSDREVTYMENQENVALRASDIGNYPYLYLVYAPREQELVPSATSTSGCEESCCPNRTIEDFQVIASDQVPGLHTIVFPDQPGPDLSTAATSEEAGKAIKDWYRTRVIAEGACTPCDDEGIFIVALDPDSPEGSAVPDSEETELYISVAANNKLISSLLTSHLSDFENPHRVTAEQIGVFPLTGGEIGHVSITAPENRYLSVSGTGATISVTRCSRLVSVTSRGLTSIVSIASPGALYVGSPCSFAVRGVLTGGITQPQAVLSLFKFAPGTLGKSVAGQQGVLSEIPGTPDASGSEPSTSKALSSGIRISTNTSSRSSRYASAPNAAIQGISTTSNGYGVYASAPYGTPALYVNGTAYFASPARFRAGMDGYVTNTFLNVSATTFVPGQVVQLAPGGMYGDFQSFVPGVELADGGAGHHIMGIVAGGVTSGVLSAQNSVIDILVVLKSMETPGPDNMKSLSTGGAGSSYTAIEDGSQLHVATHGIFPDCHIAPSSADIFAGDWLTASPAGDLHGYAIKAPVNPDPGTVIGIALEDWPSVPFVGTIPIFVNIR